MVLIATKRNEKKLKRVGENETYFLALFHFYTFLYQISQLLIPLLFYNPHEAFFSLIKGLNPL